MAEYISGTRTYTEAEIMAMAEAERREDAFRGRFDPINDPVEYALEREAWGLED